MEMESTSKTSSTAIFQCVLSSLAAQFSHVTRTSRGYTCALIVRSRAVDPRRTVGMAEKEENAWQYFEELKCTLPELSPRSWEKDFKFYIDKFIAECLFKKDVITALPGEDEEEKELDRAYLYELRRLVAGAIQEWELVQQPKHAAACAKLDSALVWQGRGYVFSYVFSVSSL